MARAAIFINWTIPVGMGHVGWGFERDADKWGCGNAWYYGGLETAGIIVGNDQENNTHNCCGSFATMIQNMKTTTRPGITAKNGGYPYHEYKIISVPNSNCGAALNAVEVVRHGGYGLHANNCMDAVFHVVKAFSGGNDHILPWPCFYWAPRWWYCAIQAKSIFLQSQASTGNWLNQHDG